MSKQKWNALYTSMFDAVLDTGSIVIEVAAWKWENDGEADIAWRAVAMLRYRADVHGQDGQEPQAAAGLISFDLEQTNETAVLVEAVHKWEELLAKYAAADKAEATA